jgi:hypothetical protein
MRYQLEALGRQVRLTCHQAAGLPLGLRILAGIEFWQEFKQ